MTLQISNPNFDRSSDLSLTEMFDALDTPLGKPEAGSFTVDSAGEQGRFASAADALQFINGGNATVTLQSKKTGARFTYRIRASKDGAVHFVSLLNGPDNETAYAYFGYIRRGYFNHGGTKARVSADASSAKAFAWAYRSFAQGVIPDSLEVWHEGRCGRCGRKLTVPSSIASGFGPECEGKIG